FVGACSRMRIVRRSPRGVPSSYYKGDTRIRASGPGETMTHRTALPARAFLTLLAAVIFAAAPAARAAERPTGAADTGVMPLDLNTGKIDTTPLAQTDPLTNEAFDPQTPPQTVEGTLIAVDPEGHSATVHTKRYGDVKMGLPPDVYVSSKHG